MTLPKLGIDVAKKTFAVALLRAEKVRQKTFDNTPTGFHALTTWLGHHDSPRCHAVVEATGTYGEDLALYLHHAGHQVSIVNPARIKAFGQSELRRDKTDRLDATLIARFALTHNPAAWTPLPPEVRHLQALVRYLEDLITQRSHWQQRLTEGRPLPAVQTSVETLLTAIATQIDAVEQQLRAHIAQHPGLTCQQELLTSIPGIGAATAARLLAEMPQLQTFRSARHAAAYTGLTPRHCESGPSVRGRTPLSKIGSARIRKALYWPAITALRCNPLLRSFGQRLRERGKTKMVVIGAVMRKLVHLAYGVLKTGQPFNENYALGT